MSVVLYINFINKYNLCIIHISNLNDKKIETSIQKLQIMSKILLAYHLCLSYEAAIILISLKSLNALILCLLGFEDFDRYEYTVTLFF